jgi:prevent-host-death family protein
MQSITATEARSNFAELVGRVGYGKETVAIERRGRPVAALVPIEDLTLIEEHRAQARQSGEARFDSLAIGAFQGIIVTRGLKPVFANRAYAEIFGYDSPQEVLDLESETPLVAPQDRARLAAYAEARMRGEEVPAEYEFQGLRKDGSTIWLNNRVQVVTWEGGPAILSAVVDITERKRVDAALAEKSAQVEAILETMDPGVSLADADLNLVVANRRFFELLDFPPEFFVLGTPFEEFIRYNAERGEYGKGDVDQLVHERVEHASRAEPHRFERTRPNGVTLEVRGRPLPGGGFVTTYTDVTEYKKAQTALRDSEARLRAIMDNAPVEIYLKDAEGRYLQINRRYEDLWGVENDAVRGRLPQEVHGQKDFADASRAHDLAVLESGRVIEQEDDVVLEDGRHTLHMIKFPVRDEAGQITGLGAVATDVTGRRQAEEALRQAHGELERRVEARTAELQQANEALRASEAQYRRFVQLSPNGVFVNRDGNFAFANPAAVRAFGAESEDDLIGKPVLDFIHPDWREVVKGRVRQVVEGAEALPHMEQLYLGLDGRAFDVETSAAPIRYQSERAVMTVFSDITERKRAEQALRDSEEQLRLVTDSLPTPIVYLDSDRRYRFVNRTGEEWYRRPRADVLGKRADEILGPSAYEEFRPYLERALAGEKLEFDTTVTYPDGVTRYVAESWVPHRAEDGTVRGYFAVVQDMTERKRAEKALEASEMRFRDIASNIPGVVYQFRLDPEGGQSFPYVSPTLQGLSGLRPDDVMADATLWIDTIHPEDRPSFDASVEASARRLEPWIWEGRMVRTSGDLWWIRGSSVPTKLEDGSLLWNGLVLDITERKRAEEALRESEELFSRAFHASPALLAMARPEDGKLYDVNETWLTTLRYSREEMIGRTAVELGLWIDPEERDRFVERLREEGSVPGYEAKFRAKGGEELDLLIAGEYLEIGGEPRLLVVSHDITERKRAEAALKEREAQLRQAQVMAKIGAFVWDDLTGRCIYCSEELAALDDMSVAEFMEKQGTNESILSRIHPDDRTRYKEVTTAATENATAYDIEYRVQSAAGRHMHWREMGEPVFDEHGRVVRTFGTVQDITDMKRAEEALKLSEGRLSQATQLAGLGHWVWDATEDRCLYCSEEHASLHGLSVEEYIRRSSTLEGEFSLTHPEDREQVKAAFRALRAGEGFEIEYRAVTPDRQVRHVREIARPVFDGDGAVIQEFGTAQDITEMKQAEEQLRQAQKMEAVGQLTGGVAHDFNNLLAVIMGNAEILQDRVGDDDRSTQAVIRAATRGAELTQRLLAFSRRQPLRPRTVDLDGLVAGMFELLARTLGETIEVEAVAGRGLRPALADPGQVENALLNLAINAQHAMPAGGKLTIETANVVLDAEYAATYLEVSPGDYVLLAVSDTGTGMAPEVLEHAFEPFFTTKDVGEGSGLGLSMVYGFAKQSGGHVTIYSEQGRGTTVKLYLPQAEGPGPDTGEAVERDAPGAKGERILVLEDDPDVRTLAVSLLEGLGYEVLEAQDGKEALVVLARDSRVDLLLSDVVLPGGMSGPQLAEEARRRDPGLKILFMSGYPEKAVRRNGSLGKSVEVLSKPFRKHDLAERVRAVLDDVSR